MLRETLCKVQTNIEALTTRWDSFLASSGKGNIVDPQQQLDSLRSELNSTRAHKQGLKYLLVRDVGLDTTGSNAHTRILLALRMPMPQISASVVGMTSIASANAFQHIASVPVSSRAR